MRLVFFVLVLVSLLIYIGQKGWLGTWSADGHEPERITHQIDPDRIRLLPYEQVQLLRDQARHVPLVLATQNLAAAQGCAELGDFSLDAAKRVAQHLVALNLGQRLMARPVDMPGWYMVYIPQTMTFSQANQLAQALATRGINDTQVIPDSDSPHYGISLGSFRDPSLAHEHRTNLEKRGVTDALVADPKSTIPGQRFRITHVDVQLATELGALQKKYNTATLSACATDADNTPLPLWVPVTDTDTSFDQNQKSPPT